MKRKLKKKRLNYVRPQVALENIEMEQGIAAASATATFVGPSNQENTPQVESWQTGQLTGNVFDW